MVRGLCPRDKIREAADGGRRTVGDVGAVGHASHPHPPHPGSNPNAGRRGRRPLRAAAKRRYQHRGKQLRKGNSLRHALGSPERGAVTALCAVTEGLVQGWCGVPALPVNPRRAGVEARPYGVWGGWHAEYSASVDRRKGRRGEVGAWNRRCRSSNGGAPETVRPTACGEMFPHRNYVVGYPEEGASGTPPPTVVACG